MTGRLRRGAVPAALAVLLALGAVVPPAGAEAPEAQGWWYRARSSELPIETPIPPTVEDDGLYVAAGPAGAIAVAALRAAVGDAPQVTITLVLSDTTGTVLIGACRTAPWKPAQAGNWEERPVADCEADAVAAVVAEDGSTATIDASSLVDDGTLDVVLIPGTAEDGTPSNFTASIAPPGPETISTGSSSPPAPPPDLSGSPSPEQPTFSPSGSSGSAPPIASPLTDFQPAGGIAAPPEPETVLEIPPVAEEVATAPLAPRPAVSTPGGPASDGGRLLGLGLVAAMGASYVVLHGRQGPVPAPLLAFGGRSAPAVPEAPPRTSTSGVGRFAREREGRPPPLT